MGESAFNSIARELPGGVGPDDRQGDFEKARQALAATYTPEGVEVYLHAKNRRFGGETAAALIRRGDLQRVLDEAELLAGGPLGSATGANKEGTE